MYARACARKGARALGCSVLNIGASGRGASATPHGEAGVLCGYDIVVTTLKRDLCLAKAGEPLGDHAIVPLA